jgi:hypothetical protein
LGLKPIHVLSIGISLAFTLNASAQAIKNPDQILKRVNSPKSQVCLPTDCETQVPDFLKDKEHPPIVRVSAVGEIPAYSRVVMIDQQKKQKKIKVLYQAAGKVRSALIPENAVLPSNARAGMKDELNAFLSEAGFQLKLARGFREDQSSPFYQLVNRLEGSLACIEKKRSQLTEVEWNAFVEQAKRDFAPDPAGKSAMIQKYTRQIFQVLNPEKNGRDLASHTLYVPLSMQWIRKYPELEKYFNSQWLVKNRFDVKIRGGNSGEGMNQRPGTEKEPSEMDFYLSMLIDMKKAVSKMDPAIQKTPEYQWLSKIDSSTGKNFDRMIFIHENTWASDSKGWQDYIPIDQQFGPVASNPILSVLIHETNVNSYSPEFLAQDTHSPIELSYRIWNCVGKRVSLAQINSSFEKQFQAMGLQPQMGVIYLGMLLPKLGEKVGCK